MRRTALLTGMFGICLLAGMAYGTIAITWQSDNGLSEYVYEADGTTLLPVGSIIQLIWSPTNTPVAPNPSDPLMPAGAGELLLDQRVTTGAGYWTFGTAQYDATNAPWLQVEDYFVSGYVYQRAFDTIATPGPGTNYGDSVSMWIVGGPLNDQDPGPASANESYITDTGLYMTDQVIGAVPEPATLALFGIGLLSLGLHRRRKQSRV